MKRNPTLNEKKLLTRIGLTPGDWLVCRHSDTGIMLKHKYTGQRKVIPLSIAKKS